MFDAVEPSGRWRAVSFLGGIVALQTELYRLQ